MSDYIPNPPDPSRDPRNDDRYYEASSGKGLTLIVGVLVALALVAGLMFFSSKPYNSVEQAQLPPKESTVNPTNQSRTPAIPPIAPATPTPANPAPAMPANPQR